MRSLDTNILLRLILNDIPKQKEAASALFNDESKKYIVEDIVFAEIVWILQGERYKYPRDRVATNVQSLISIPQIVCNRALLEKSLSHYIKHPKISFIDACLTAYAELSNVALLTFDKNLVDTFPKIIVSL